jgi:hypothetical protein
MSVQSGKSIRKAIWALEAFMGNRGLLPGLIWQYTCALILVINSNKKPFHAKNTDVVPTGLAGFHETRNLGLKLRNCRESLNHVAAVYVSGERSGNIDNKIQLCCGRFHFITSTR